MLSLYNTIAHKKRKKVVKAFFFRSLFTICIPWVNRSEISKKIGSCIYKVLKYSYYVKFKTWH